MKFDRLAAHYDWMEAVLAGGLLQRARTAWLDTLDGRRRVLSVGEGHGRFAGAFARRFPGAELTCVDESRGMLERGRRRAGAARWIRATVPEWRPPEGRFDAVVTCFFLDCFPGGQLRRVMDALAAATTHDATWLVVDFAVPMRGLARRRAQAIHAAMYAFFRAVTRLPAQRLTPPDAILRAHGFRLVGRREFSWGLIRADCWCRDAPHVATGAHEPGGILARE